MAERYEDIIAGGKVIGRILVSDGSGLPPVPTHITEFYADDLLSEFTRDEFDLIDAYTKPAVKKLLRRLMMRKKAQINVTDSGYIADIGLLLSESLISQSRHDELIQGLPIQ